ncbi:RNA polymerase recycling motor HelD [Clostridium polynesiense]|uniref:RNA polymerase recycling motor HelD n=1 Tax=Clostridium polynesiense TaxID=1325933 RepID=UPI0005902271|nr:RNA polymerase recycling motor HelD [Clostridium polynesiense]
MDSKQKNILEEKNNLIVLRQWLSNKIVSINKYRENLGKRLKELKKASRGSYNEELETITNIYNITEKNYINYNEVFPQPYFARIDFREYRHSVESLYIGKFSLGDEDTGEEKVIDWRAPIADLYYSGTRGEAYYKAPYGIISGELTLKRKFLFKEGEIQDIFDEGINEIIIKSNTGEEALVDEFLRINLQESTGKKLKDVVATIQKEQNEIIRAEKNIPIIVQGSAGSGKTTVALHRLAYLLYRYKENISGKDILVIAPNMIFLDYISEVLPSLGVESVKQSTLENLAKDVLKIKYRILSKDKKLAGLLEDSSMDDYKYIINTSRIKGSLAYKEIMNRVVRITERNLGFIKDMTFESSIIFEGKEINRLFLKDLSHLPIKKRKDEIKRYLKTKLEGRIKELQDKSDFQYEYLIARTKKTMEDGIERRKRLIELYDERDSVKKAIKDKTLKNFDDYFINWGNINIIDLYSSFFNDEDLFMEATSGKIPKVLAEYMKKSFNDNINSGYIDSEDLCAMLYLKIVIQGIEDENKYSHIVIDEAQDYSLFELDVIRAFTHLDSMTIVGDIGQGIYYYKGINSWDKVMKEVFKNNASFMPLTQSYRSTVEVINLANKVLKLQDSDIKPAVPVLRHGKEPEFIKFTNYSDLSELIDNIVSNLHKAGKNSTAVICKNQKDCRNIRDNLNKYSRYNWGIIGEKDKDIDMSNMIIPSYMTKGLEFDCTVIYHCSEGVYDMNPQDTRLLYVALTRALHEEYIVYKKSPSTLIKDLIR